MQRDLYISGLQIALWTCRGCYYRLMLQHPTPQPLSDSVMRALRLPGVPAA